MTEGIRYGVYYMYHDVNGIPYDWETFSTYEKALEFYYQLLREYGNRLYRVRIAIKAGTY